MNNDYKNEWYTENGTYRDDSNLYRVGEMPYDKGYIDQLNKTGGRVDTSSQRLPSKELYGSDYTGTTLKTINSSGYITDTRSSYIFKDARGNSTRRYFTSKDLYIIPANSRGATGDKAFFQSIENTAYTTYLKNNASKGGPIRLPNLPFAAGLGRDPNGDVNRGYIQCLTLGSENKIKNRGLVPLASSPQEIQDSVSSEVASDNAVGSSQSFEIFSSVGSRVVSFSFVAYADYLPAPFTDIKDYCYALKQMNYPTYSGLQVNSPDVVFEYGGIKIRGIPQISFSYSNTVKRGIVDKATISVQITETEEIVNGTAKI